MNLWWNIFMKTFLQTQVLVNRMCQDTFGRCLQRKGFGERMKILIKHLLLMNYTLLFFIIKRLGWWFSFKRPWNILINSSPRDELKGDEHSGEAAAGLTSEQAQTREWDSFREPERFIAGEMRKANPAPAVSSIIKKSLSDLGRSRTRCLLIQGAWWVSQD